MDGFDAWTAGAAVSFFCTLLGVAGVVQARNFAGGRYKNRAFGKDTLSERAGTAAVLLGVFGAFAIACGAPALRVFVAVAFIELFALVFFAEIALSSSIEQIVASARGHHSRALRDLRRLEDRVGDATTRLSLAAEDARDVPWLKVLFDSLKLLVIKALLRGMRAFWWLCATIVAAIEVVRVPNLEVYDRSLSGLSALLLGCVTFALSAIFGPTEPLVAVSGAMGIGVAAWPAIRAGQFATYSGMSIFVPKQDATKVEKFTIGDRVSGRDSEDPDWVQRTRWTSAVVCLLCFGLAAGNFWPILVAYGVIGVVIMGVIFAWVAVQRGLASRAEVLALRAPNFAFRAYSHKLNNLLFPVHIAVRRTAGYFNANDQPVVTFEGETRTFITRRLRTAQSSLEDVETWIKEQLAQARQLDEDVVGLLSHNTEPVLVRELATKLRHIALSKRDDWVESGRSLTVEYYAVSPRGRRSKVISSAQTTALDRMDRDAFGETTIDISLSDVVDLFLSLVNNAAQALEKRHPRSNDPDYLRSDARAGTGATREAALLRMAVNLDRSSFGGLSISVYDNGPGIPTVLRNRIGQAFVSTKENEDLRHGLGLYIGRVVARAHGGRLEFSTSAAEQGSFTEFVFSLPMRRLGGPMPEYAA